MDYSLSKWDGQSHPEAGESWACVFGITYDASVAKYVVDLPQGSRINISRKTAEGYLLRDGYSVEDANKVLEDSKKGRVELKKKASAPSAQLQKFAEVIQNDRLEKVAKLLKSSKNRRSTFTSMVKKSVMQNEIPGAYLEAYQSALSNAETTNTDSSWIKLAKISNDLFKKAQLQ